nr:MAG TPA: hypothetical protein [Caudoviricetes sp.]
MGINYNRKILKRNNVISFTKLVMKNKYKNKGPFNKGPLC